MIRQMLAIDGVMAVCSFKDEVPLLRAMA